jgi:hypothetical protein
MTTRSTIKEELHKQWWNLPLVKNGYQHEK